MTQQSAAEPRGIGLSEKIVFKVLSRRPGNLKVVKSNLRHLQEREVAVTLHSEDGEWAHMLTRIKFWYMCSHRAVLNLEEGQCM